MVGDGGGSTPDSLTTFLRVEIVLSTPDFLTTFLRVEIVLSSLACLASTFSLLSAVDYLSMVSCLRSSHKMK